MRSSARSSALAILRSSALAICRSSARALTRWERPASPPSPPSPIGFPMSGILRRDLRRRRDLLLDNNRPRPLGGRCLVFFHHFQGVGRLRITSFIARRILRNIQNILHLRLWCRIFVRHLSGVRFSALLVIDCVVGHARLLV